MSANHFLVGQRLIDAGLITEEQLQVALNAYKEDPSKRVTQHLIELGFTTSKALNRTHLPRKVVCAL